MSHRPVIVAKSPGEARILRFIRSGFLSDLFFDSRTWPAYMQQLAIKVKLNHVERSRFAYFLLVNGFPPSRLLEYMSFGRSFDYAARSQILFILNNFRSYSYPYFDMYSSRFRR